MPDCTHTCAGMVHDCSITDVTHLVDNLSVKIVPTGLKAQKKKHYGNEVQFFVHSHFI